MSAVEDFDEGRGLRVRRVLWWVALLMALLGVGVGGVNMWRWSLTGEAVRISLGSGVFGVRGGESYAWLIKTTHGAALIDTGGEPEAVDLLAELRAQGLTAEDVHTVLLTQGLHEHYEAAGLFRNARVLVGPGDAALIRGEAKRTAPVRVVTWATQRPPVPLRLEELKGDQSLDVDGLEIQAIHVPGHTPGSMVYRLGEILFTGDSLWGHGESVEVAPWVFSESRTGSRASFAKLKDVPFTRIASGHGGLVEDAKEKLRRAGLLGAR